MSTQTLVELAWLNGKVVDIEDASPSIASNSLHMSTGVFDGLMAYWNDDHYNLHRASEHYRRFKHGAGSMDLPFKWTPDQLKEATLRLLKELPARTYYIRPICYRGGQSVPAITWRGISQPVDVCIFAVACGRDNSEPWSAELSQIERISGKAAPVAWKACGVYVNSFLAQQSAERAGYDTGLMLDQYGRVAEASTSNVFFIDGKVLVTPSLTPEIFPGITRQLVIETAKKLGIAVQEVEIRPSDLERFDGAFLCATLIELKPLCRIGPHVYRTDNLGVFNDLLNRFREITHT